MKTLLSGFHIDGSKHFQSCTDQCSPPPSSWVPKSGCAAKQLRRLLRLALTTVIKPNQRKILIQRTNTVPLLGFLQLSALVLFFSNLISMIAEFLVFVVYSVYNFSSTQITLVSVCRFGNDRERTGLQSWVCQENCVIVKILQRIANKKHLRSWVIFS